MVSRVHNKLVLEGKSSRYDACLCKEQRRIWIKKGHMQHKQSPRIIDITAMEVAIRLEKRQQLQPNQG